MRFALFSDIHSNLQALIAVFEDMQKRKVDHLVCLGDVVGYNAKPSECLELVRKSGAELILGNHDCYACSDEDLDWFNPLAKAGLNYSRAALSKEQKKYLASLPYIIDFEVFTVVHASLYLPDEWDYVLDSESAKRHFEEQERPLCFIGHTHQVHVHRCDQKSRVRSQRVPKTLTPKKGVRYLINVGSVGQPRDRDPRASYVIYDTDRNKVEFHRVEYPVDQVVDEILNAELPQYLALRLLKGM